MIKAQTLKGFRDFLPSEARKRQYVINTLKQMFESYGFEPLETPALEYEEIMLGKYGDEGDKLMYRFEDNGKRKVALRYDQTVPLARVVAQYQNELPMPFKRYQIQNVWRAENPQKGRFREFLQCDVDIVGSVSSLADAEVIAVAAKSLEKLGFKNFKILINDRTIFQELAKNEKIEKKNLPFVIRAIDKLKKVGREKVIIELTQEGLPKDKALSILQSMEGMSPTERLGEVLFYLKSNFEKINCVFSPTLARGLDYYTGMIFEVEIDGYSAGSVAGGGRYDNLIGMFAGKDIPAVGFSFGFDRLMETMQQNKLFPANLQTTKVLVTIFSKDLKQQSIDYSLLLRSNGVSTELYLDENAKMEKQLKYADKKGIPYVVIIGPEEAAKNMVTLRNMRTREQQTISLDQLSLLLKK